MITYDETRNSQRTRGSPVSSCTAIQSGHTMILLLIADGRSIHTQRWAEYFATHGHTVHLITYDPMDRTIKGVRSVRGGQYVSYFSIVKFNSKNIRTTPSRIRERLMIPVKLVYLSKTNRFMM